MWLFERNWRPRLAWNDTNAYCGLLEILLRDKNTFAAIIISGNKGTILASLAYLMDEITHQILLMLQENRKFARSFNGCYCFLTKRRVDWRHIGVPCARRWFTNCANRILIARLIGNGFHRTGMANHFEPFSQHLALFELLIFFKSNVRSLNFRHSMDVSKRHKKLFEQVRKARTVSQPFVLAMCKQVLLT